MKLLVQAGYNVYEKDIKPDELDSADEIFSTGNINKIQAVTVFKNRELGMDLLRNVRGICIWILPIVNGE